MQVIPASGLCLPLARATKTEYEVGSKNEKCYRAHDLREVDELLVRHGIPPEKPARNHEEYNDERHWDKYTTGRLSISHYDLLIIFCVPISWNSNKEITVCFLIAISIILSVLKKKQEHI